jgi:hypothetical protein
MASQGASGGNQGAGSEFAKFTKPAAQRIAKAVLRVEGGNRDQGPLGFEHHVQTGGKVFRVCSFTGTWSKGTTHTTSFYGVTATPNTVAATNLFVDVKSCDTASSSVTAACAIAKYAGTWYLISAECGCS